MSECQSAYPGTRRCDQRGPAPLESRPAAQELSNGEEEPVLERRKGDHGTYGHRAPQHGDMLNNLRTSDEIDEGRHDCEEGASEHKEPTSNHELAYYQIHQVLFSCWNWASSIFLSSEDFDQQNPAHRERFLHQCGERGQTFLRLFARLPPLLLHFIGNP